MVESNKREALAQLRQRFRYKGESWPDKWRVMTAPAGPLVGDCEDFALTLAYHLAGRSWWRLAFHLLTLRSVIWHCVTLGGDGHAVLWHRGQGWADNMVPHWRPVTPHRRRFPYLAPLVALKLSAAPLFRWLQRGA